MRLTSQGLDRRSDRSNPKPSAAAPSTANTTSRLRRPSLGSVASRLFFATVRESGGSSGLLRRSSSSGDDDEKKKKRRLRRPRIESRGTTMDDDGGNRADSWTDGMDDVKRAREYSDFQSRLGGGGRRKADSCPPEIDDGDADNCHQMNERQQQQQVPEEQQQRPQNHQEQKHHHHQQQQHQHELQQPQSEKDGKPAARRWSLANIRRDLPSNEESENTLKTASTSSASALSASVRTLSNRMMMSGSFSGGSGSGGSSASGGFSASSSGGLNASSSGAMKLGTSWSLEEEPSGVEGAGLEERLQGEEGELATNSAERGGGGNTGSSVAAAAAAHEGPAVVAPRRRRSVDGQRRGSLRFIPDDIELDFDRTTNCSSTEEELSSDPLQRAAETVRKLELEEEESSDVQQEQQKRDCDDGGHDVDEYESPPLSAVSADAASASFSPVPSPRATRPSLGPKSRSLILEDPITSISKPTTVAGRSLSMATGKDAALAAEAASGGNVGGPNAAWPDTGRPALLDEAAAPSEGTHRNNGEPKRRVSVASSRSRASRRSSRRSSASSQMAAAAAAAAASWYDNQEDDSDLSEDSDRLDNNTHRCRRRTRRRRGSGSKLGRPKGGEEETHRRKRSVPTTAMEILRDCGGADGNVSDLDDESDDDGGSRLDAILAGVVLNNNNANNNNGPAAVNNLNGIGAVANTNAATAPPAAATAPAAIPTSGDASAAAAAAMAPTATSSHSRRSSTGEDSIIDLNDLLRPAASASPETSTPVVPASSPHPNDNFAPHASWPHPRRSSTVSSRVGANGGASSILDRLQSLDVREMMQNNPPSAVAAQTDGDGTIATDGSRGGVLTDFDGNGSWPVPRRQSSVISSTHGGGGGASIFDRLQSLDMQQMQVQRNDGANATAANNTAEDSRAATSAQSDAFFASADINGDGRVEGGASRSSRQQQDDNVLRASLERQNVMLFGGMGARDRTDLRNMAHIPAEDHSTARQMQRLSPGPLLIGGRRGGGLPHQTPSQNRPPMERRRTEPPRGLESSVAAVAATLAELSESLSSLDFNESGADGGIAPRAPFMFGAGSNTLRGVGAGASLASGRQQVVSSMLSFGGANLNVAAGLRGVNSSDRLQNLAMPTTTAADPSSMVSSVASASPSTADSRQILPSLPGSSPPIQPTSAGNPSRPLTSDSNHSSEPSSLPSVSATSARPGGGAGPTPLYHAVSSCAPYDVIKGLIESDPSSTGHKNGGGMTPLHCSIERYDSPISVIRMLLAANPSTATVRSRKGLTPLDLLWKRFVDPDPYRSEVTKSAAAHLSRLMEDVVADDGCERALTDESDDVDVNWEDGKPSHREAQRKAKAMRALLANPPLRDFWELMTLFVRAAHHGTVQDPLPADFGRWRVVHACIATGCEPLLIRFAAALYPEQLRERDEPTGRLPLHIASASTDICTERTVMRLFPLAAWCHDKDGRLPLNLAIEAGKPWRLVRTLFMTAPQSLTTRDVKTHMLPFMIAATKDNSSLDCVYRLLRESPLQVLGATSM